MPQHRFVDVIVGDERMSIAWRAVEGDAHVLTPQDLIAYYGDFVPIHADLVAIAALEDIIQYSNVPCPSLHMNRIRRSGQKLIVSAVRRCDFLGRSNRTSAWHRV